MSRLSLEVFRSLHPPSVAAGHPVEAVRLFTQISLSSPDGWTRFRRVVVDTGAPISLLPSTFWQTARYVARGRSEVGGVAARPECRIPATLAEVDCVLSNAPVALGPLRMYAYLAEADDAPALLGMSGFIERGTLHVCVEGQEAFLEIT